MDALRRRLAMRAARAAVARRSPRALAPVVGHRTVFVLLPPADAALRAAWDLVSRLDLPDRLLVMARTADEIGFAPDRFAGAIRHIGADERDWRRLPTAKARESIWTQQPDIALNLAPASDLPAVLLAGASPAAVRVGFHDPAHEAFYDLMVGGTASGSDGIEAVERLLRRVDPPIVPFV